MAGILKLEELLKTMSPELQAGEYVFCTVKGDLSDYVRLNPIASFIESEGLTLILKAEVAEKEGIDFAGHYKQITLMVHSSLDAVGLTAAVSNKLTERGISANVVAAFYHDHIFVQSEKAQEALAALQEISS
jgi:hypothetical protein